MVRKALEVRIAMRTELVTGDKEKRVGTRMGSGI